MSEKKAYENILKEIKKNKEKIDDQYYINSVISGLENRIAVQEVCELFDIHDLPENFSPQYIKIKENEVVIMYCVKGREYLSWPDGQGQPEDEYVYKIGFPTGAYIFGDFYPEDLFKKFFLELKSYGPKFSDTTNRDLYFSPDNAKVIHEAYPAILKKYRDMAGDEYKKIRAEKLRKELEGLE